MLTLIMTSPEGNQVTFSYNEHGTLAQLTFSPNLTDKAYTWLFERMPVHRSMIPALKACAKAATFAETKMQITFDMFWNRYNDKERSSKKKTQQKWNKMTEDNQIKAYLYIPTAERKRGNADKKYATTYLDAELWNN